MAKKILLFIFLVFIYFPLDVHAQNSQLYLDYPAIDSTYGDKMYIYGWFMSDVGSSYISISIDGNKIVQEVERYSRDDVLKNVFGYGDYISNPLPGFYSVIDLMNFEDGQHILSVSAYDKENNLLKVIDKSFFVHKNYVTSYIDNPNLNSLFGDYIILSGWVMTTNSKIISNVYIDNKLIEVDFERTERSDVINAILGYGDKFTNSTPGFNSKISVNGFKDGEHTIKIDYLSIEGGLLYSVSRNFFIKRDVAKVHLDSPVNIIHGDLIRICGWLMSTNSNLQIKFYIDNKSIDVNYQKYKRDDVWQAITNYGSPLFNDKPGFFSDYDVSYLNDGSHVLRVDVLSSNDELLSSDSKNFKLFKYKGLIYMDAPFNDTITGTDLSVIGWSMSDDKNAEIQLYLDDVEIQSSIIRYERQDVLDVYSVEYGDDSINNLPGYLSTIDLSKYKDGSHILKSCLKVGRTGEELNCVSKMFSLKKYDSNMFLDSPLDNSNVNGTSLIISGWVMSTDKNMLIRLFFDNEDVTTGIVRYERQDVLDVYSDSYGGSITNPYPGFTNEIDVFRYKDGFHSIRVVIYSSNTEEILFKIDKKIYLKKNQSILYLDYPVKYNFSRDVKLTIQGWELSDFSDSKVKILLDSTELSVDRVNRDDVIRAYPNLYGGSNVNTLPGFYSTYSLANVSPGEHIIQVYIYNYLGEVINSEIRKIYVYSQMYFGIDVSSHQNRIDWGLVSKAGVDFAILRLGYGDNWQSQDDVQFMNNVNGVANNHIPFGVYIYSYATNLHGASGLNDDSASIDSEIAHTLRLLNSINSNQKQFLKLPVFLDMEDDSTIYIGKSRLTQFADYFCSAIESNGYKCGVYANKNWLVNYLDSRYLVDKYDIWLAHYTNDYNDMSDYNGKYHIWQYSSTGRLNGVNSGFLDMDISFKKYW